MKTLLMDRCTSVIRISVLKVRLTIALLDEFIREVQKKYPEALIQFEDFQTANAFRLLEKIPGQDIMFQ
jgi:malic enzyme